MARMYKIEAYIVDPNEVYEDGEACFADLIDGSEVYCPTLIRHTAVEFKWDDNLPINCVGCTEEECRRFMEDAGVHFQGQVQMDRQMD